MRTNRSETKVLTSEPVSAATVDRPKARAKKPRPCFNDGSLTRVFKFPSRTYPKSSYYVTSDEVVVRIRKARRRWKLVVPKKRVVSYRTNRWFTKPRWIELELTFTQASRLGLVETRKAVDAGDDFPSVNRPPVGDDAAVRLSSNETGPAIAPASDDPADGLIGGAPEDISGTSSTSSTSEEMDDDTSDFEFVLDQPYDDCAEEPPIVQNREAAAERPVSSVASRAALGEHLPAPAPIEPESMPVNETAPRPYRERHHSRAVWSATVLVMLLMAGVGTWLMIRPQPVSLIADAPACPHKDASPPCPRAIVTGSNTAPEGPHDPILAQPLPDTPAAPASGEDRASAEPVGSPSEIQAGRSEAPPPGSDMDTASPAQPAHAESDRSRPAVTAAMPGASAQSDPPSPAASCRDLVAIAQSMRIQFDYASPLPDQSVLASLVDFGRRLQACPSLIVIIEGHTDSDGHEDRNETLSWRRADVVGHHLIAAGATREQLSIVAYGQTRPDLPNVSIENKRRNRRVTLVVTPRS